MLFHGHWLQIGNYLHGYVIFNSSRAWDTYLRQCLLFHEVIIIYALVAVWFRVIPIYNAIVCVILIPRDYISQKPSLNTPIAHPCGPSVGVFCLWFCVVCSIVYRVILDRAINRPTVWYSILLIYLQDGHSSFAWIEYPPLQKLSGKCHFNSIMEHG